MSEPRRAQPEEHRIRPEDIAGARVSLKPLLGIPPRSWVPAAWIAAMAALLAAVLVLPGILGPGSILAFSGTPSGAAVSVDGNYRGSTEGRIFVKPGSHEVEISRSGFLPEKLTVRTGGRIFGSLFFPRRHSISYALKPGDASAELARAFAEFARWSGTGKPSAVYQIPLVLSDSLLALAETGSLAGLKEGGVAGMAPGTVGVASSPQALRDGLRSVFLSAGAGASSPLAVASGARALLSVARTGYKAPVSGTLAAYLSDMLPRDASKARTRIDELKKAGSTAEFTLPPSPGKPAVPAADISGVIFLPVAGGFQVMAGIAPSGTAVPYREALSGFALATTETTVGQWAAFLAANPAWAPGRRDDLIGRGLADKSYLEGWNPSGDTNLPVTGVSWHAATAYCAWLSRIVEPAWAVVLPSEAMWERAASGAASAQAAGKAVWASADRTGPSRVGSVGRNATGHADLFGNVWEWTSDSWAAYPAFSGGNLASPEKAVRGGSWANAEGSVQAGSRGAVAAAHSSAFLGFRPALVKR